MHGVWVIVMHKRHCQNPDLAFSDKALYDSCRNEAAFNYYKNINQVLQVAPGSNSPHGAFKLKFNKIATAALTDNGKLPIGQKFPEGSLVVKEIESNGLYAIMYKHNNSWLWAEISNDGTTIFSVTKDATTACISCHNQSGQRDLVVSFNYY
jgi:hypothetical protein